MRCFVKSFWPLAVVLFFLVAACNAGLSPKPGEDGGGNNLGDGGNIVNLPQPGPGNLPQPPGAPPNTDGATPVTYELIVNVTGYGKVETSDFVIECGAGFEMCAYDYNDLAVVVLIARDTVDSFFVEWTGDCTGSDCTLTMDSDKTVAAVFEERPVFFGAAPPYTLTVNVVGGGEFSAVQIIGTTTNCLSSRPCAIDLPDRSAVNLNPVSGPGYIFKEWSGVECPSINPYGYPYPICFFILDSPITVTATFDPMSDASAPTPTSVLSTPPIFEDHGLNFRDSPRWSPPYNPTEEVIPDAVPTH